MIPGFQVIEIVHRGTAISVLRCRQERDGAQVILKGVHADTATHLDRVRIRHERKMLEIATRGGVPHIPSLIGLHEDGAHLALICADVGGESLTSLRRKRPLTLREVLRIATCVAEAVGALQRLRVVHKDICPNNIVYNPNTGETQLIDFGISTSIPRELQQVLPLKGMEGTISYISPEQTGRTNRMLDARSDLYSLGATLYAMLAGHAPFENDDRLKLVHAILTQTPPSLLQVASVPAVVSHMVDKLLQKDPEQRYQSASGLLRDLQAVLEALERDGPVPTLAVGQHDRSEDFQIPDTLYGREPDKLALLGAYARAATGCRELVVVRGPSGIGKSALVNELQAALVEHDGLFLGGKYDQLRRHVPFTAISQALAALVRRIQKEPDDLHRRWTRRLQKAVGNIGRVAVDIVPSLEGVIGPQRSLPQLGPQENENRLLTVLQRLVACIAEMRALVLFLDDVQWADAGTLKLLKLLLLDTEPCKGLLLIIAYRDSEVAAGHPLGRLIEDMRAARLRPTEIAVAPMQLADVERLVEDVTRAPRETSGELAREVLKKTEGNPFFVREFLTYLNREELLAYAPEAGCWQWDLGAVQRTSVTQNVLTLTAAKLASLPDASQWLLSLAACLGNTFLLSTLTEMSGRGRAHVVEHLEKSLQLGVLVILSGDPRDATYGNGEVTYKFYHDRLQQAAYQMLSDADAATWHFQIGQKLLAGRDPARPGDDVIAVVDHLNAGQACINAVADRLDLARLNVQAAKVAKRSAAYGIAIGYLEQAQRLLPVDAWQAHYALRRELGLELIDNTFVLGDTDRADTTIHELLERSVDGMERAELQQRRVLAMTALSRYPEALEAGLAGLRALGFHLPAHPTPVQVRWAFVRARIALRGRSVEALGDLPALQEPRIEKAMRVLGALAIAAHFSNTPLMVLTALTMVRLTVRYGISTESAFACSVLCVTYSQRNDFAQARRYALATRLLIHRRPDSVNQGPGLCFTATFAEFTRVRVQERAGVFDALYELQHETGERLFAGLTAFSDLRGVLLASVDACVEKMATYDGFVAARGSPQLASWWRSLRQLLRCLRGETLGPTSFGSKDYDEAAERAWIQSGKAGSAGQIYGHFKTLALWVHRDIAGARDAMLGAVQHGIFERATGETLAAFGFFCALTCIAYGRAQGSRHPADRRLFARAVAKLRAIAAEGPDNFAGLHTLVLAEQAGLRGRVRAAMRGYERATEELSRCGYPAFFAAGTECAGRFHQQRGAPVQARFYLQLAHDSYLAWGARLKVLDLQREFPVLASAAQAAAHDGIATTSVHSTSTSSEELSYALDIPAFIRASQAFAGETTEGGLLPRVVEVLSEASGATRALLYLQESDALVLKADSAPVDGLRPDDIVQYVARSKEAVRWHEGMSFDEDPYVRRARPKSILCTPIVHQGRLKGVLYLENAHLARAFNDERAMVVSLLSNHAAIAIESTRAYTMLEQLVAERTGQLEEAHARLLRLERQDTEIQMAGGFAHEMRNALVGARMASEIVAPISPAQAQGISLYEQLVATLDEGMAAIAQGLDPSEALALQTAALTASRECVGQLRGAMEEVHEGLRRSMRITTHILEYAQVGSLLPGDEAFVAGPVLRKLLDEFAPEFERQAIRVAVEVPEDLVLPLRSEHAVTIVRNLLANARDAVCEVNPTARQIRLSAGRAQGRIVLEVEDSGIGMTDSVKQRVFQPFFSTKGAKGMGLSLGYSRKLAHVYGGDLEFTSQPAAGSTFRLTLPATSAASKGH